MADDGLGSLCESHPSWCSQAAIRDAQTQQEFDDANLGRYAVGLLVLAFALACGILWLQDWQDRRRR